jgi:hypothetical protein
VKRVAYTVGLRYFSIFEVVIDVCLYMFVFLCIYICRYAGPTISMVRDLCVYNLNVNKYVHLTLF